MRIGAHVSGSGGLLRTIERAVEIGAECAQIFVGAPQRWAGASYSDQEVADFRALAASHDVGPNVVHALYLVNLASLDLELRERSVQALITQMAWCDRLEALGLVVHVGSSKGASSRAESISAVVSGIERVLAATKQAMFLVENTAGMGESIGSDFADIGQIIQQLGGDQRVGVCLDTAHTFEAGHDISTRDGLDSVLDSFDRLVGLDRLQALHANDSKTAFGSKVDRHENIGRGHLGEDAFGYVMTHPALQDQPFFLEVPGLAGKGPDSENIDVLRRLAGLGPSPIWQALTD